MSISCLRFPTWAIVLVCALAPRAQAETFVVTRFDDPLPATCTTASCSLREAAIAAGANDPFAGTDRIQLGVGTYTLIRGPLSHDEGLEVVGVAAAQTHVVTDVPLFGEVHSRSLTLRGMSIQTTADTAVLVMYNDSHLVLDDIAVPVGGGRISVGDTTDLEIQGSDLRDTVTCGQADGSCTIVDSQLVRFEGFRYPDSDGPVVLLQRTTIDGELDPSGSWSGLKLRGGNTFDIEDSDIVNTTGGIWIQAEQTPDDAPRVTLRRVRYLENADPIYAQFSGHLRVQDSEFRDNPSRAIYADNGADVVVIRSSFVNNKVDGNAGGAIVIEDAASVRIENSTFSGNSFSVDAAADGARGAAIGWRNGAGLHLDLRQVTIARPAVMPVGVQGTAIGGYGGAADVTVDATNSILAGSCKFDAGALLNNLGNIESPGNFCGFDVNQNHVSVTAQELALGELGDHGGYTPSYEPAADSVAIDSAGSIQCLDLDQRGYARPFGNGCDIGAVEVGADDRIFADGFE